ncbi:chemotaxis protein CheD [Bacillus marinisedimentorum]|uniref:chemotaxis protein CheD n=1 Tax=Bacillus marinisedimentorum TaxID=1821260 RepID=UPI0007E1F23F|nr:chemotaxis protein CheD [Bacillus marinisedimentorum]
MVKQAVVVKVGIADLNTVRPPDVIRTSGLGSCVGVILFDKISGLAGLAHIMLPDSALAKNGQFNEAKYADTSIDKLLSTLMGQGAGKHRLKAKIAGGAQMFQFAGGQDMMRIGQRNVEAVKKRLGYHRIPITAEDTGGHSGRTIEFDPQTGVLTVRTVNRGVQCL